MASFLLSVTPVTGTLSIVVLLEDDAILVIDELICVVEITPEEMCSLEDDISVDDVTLLVEGGKEESIEDDSLLLIDISDVLDFCESKLLDIGELLVFWESNDVLEALEDCEIIEVCGIDDEIESLVTSSSKEHPHIKRVRIEIVRYLNFIIASKVILKKRNVLSKKKAI